MGSTPHWTWQVFGPHATFNFSTAAESSVLWQSVTNKGNDLEQCMSQVSFKSTYLIYN
ncbi:hypothetical protein HanXRQr2_Chr14g0658251 [Helianthus annuus]|uniref:Uncharacterized protein n=1 Tax=Helianthus annuus TaxID=4232 RepID=A0A9K3ED52_HELAN|nr:hypothetical protein HanXRQr2_Chr14g0658251 [Helianthus annuus]